MKEIEAKARQPKGIEKALRSIGARKSKPTRQKNTIYNSKLRDFVRTGELVRVREEGKSIKLAYKKARFENGIKHADELECEAGPEIYAILERLGLYPEIFYEKRRTEYRLPGCTVSLDEVKGLPKTLEIEVVSRTGQGAGGKVREVMKKLGIGQDDIISASYPEMIREKMGTEAKK